MEVKTFFAKVDSINETTYDTNTLSVLTKDKERITIRIDQNEKLNLNAVYYFEVKEIEFKEKIQLLVTDYEGIEDKELELSVRQELMSSFYEYAPKDSEEIKEIIEGYLSKITNVVIKDIVLDMYNLKKAEFYLYPAATKFHHAYIGGLSYHTSTMLKLIDGFKSVYNFLNEELLIAGIILHDMCKVRELSNYAGAEYTKEGKMLGHITMSVKMIELTASKYGHVGKEEVLLLEHMVLSHHYYGNYGSPKKPMIPEALILHFIDNIDSKMTVLEESLDTIEPGEFTSPLMVLDRERYYKSNLK
ncbi:MAG: 3'-5' exoribonuclease YhaM [Candidatus Izimaplasma bacterium HR2]|nr:MAG: 3'-5' exoribonuclease YhaM [Candidatus Izimaplasma bacterium HR2]